jgi:hypothetical protein
MRDRTADLFAASEALSQLSYSPELIESFNNWPNSYQTCFQRVDLTLAENEAHYEQQPLNCQHLFVKKSIYLVRNALTDRIMSKVSIYCLSKANSL